MLPRVVGILLVILAVGLFAAPRAIASWLGRPAGWGGLVESSHDAGRLSDTAYKGYRAYTFVSGWFWFLLFELLLLGFGAYLLVSGRWMS